MYNTYKAPDAFALATLRKFSAGFLFKLLNAQLLHFASLSVLVLVIGSFFNKRVFSYLKVLANEDTLLRTHYCRHKCFPVCQRAQHLLRTQILCPGHKNVSDFVQKHFVSTTNVSQSAQPKTHHGQQCVRNNVSSFTRALTLFSCVFVSGVRYLCL